MSSIEEVLWNIFTHYSLNGNPKDPSRLHSMALLKLCKDIMALDQIMTEAPITQADLHLIYTSVLRSPSKSRDPNAEKSDKLNFDEFLTCILRIAQKCYPSAANQEEAMQQLLMDNILPMAHRRVPKSIAATVLKEPGIEHLLKYYESSLQPMFKYFAAASDQLTKDRNMVKATQHIVRTFDDQVRQIQKANARCVQQTAVAKMMSYADFLKFTSDLGLVSSLPITIVEFGDIYLTVTSFSNFSTSLRRIEFSEFCEALVRIALRAFQDLHHVSNEDKVKGLLLNMWRYSQELLGAHMLDYGTLHGGGFISAKEELLRSTETFGQKFKAAWARDGYRSYLEGDGEGRSGSVASGGAAAPAATPRKAVSVRGGTNAATGASAASTPAKAASATPKQHQHQHLTPAPSPGASLLSRLKASRTPAGAHAQGHGHGAHDIPDTASVHSAITGRSGTLAETIAELRTKKERLLNTLHERTEESENFVVTASDGGQFRIMVADNDKFGDHDRIDALDLRKVFLHKPDLAAIIYDTLVEEGITSEDAFEAGEDEAGMDEHDLGISLDDLALMQQHEGSADGFEADEEG